MSGRRSRKPRPSLEVERREPEEGRPALEIRSSARRRKTATAWWEGATLVVAMPAHVRGAERDELIGWLIERSARRRPSMPASDPELLERSRRLTERYDLGVEPASVRFVTNQSRRWGSCTPSTGVVRISHRLQVVPDWVLDAVLVHELAHLAHHDHGAAFHELANRHPRQAEATQFLEAYQLGIDMAGSGFDAEGAVPVLVDQEDPVEITAPPAIEPPALF
jgi:hypothetical protein